MRENQNKSKTVAAGETRRLTDPFRLNCRLLLNRKIRFKIPLAVANANIFRREQNNTRYVLSNTNKILQFCQNTHTLILRIDAFILTNAFTVYLGQIV